MELNAAKLVASSVLGYDFKRIIVNGKDYVINPPTIHKICGATYWLSDMGDGATLKELLSTMRKMDNLAKALSFFICDNESLAEELSHGTMQEVIDGLEAGFGLMDTQNFLRLSVLMKSAERLIARPNR